MIRVVIREGGTLEEALFFLERMLQEHVNVRRVACEDGEWIAYIRP